MKTCILLFALLLTMTTTIFSQNPPIEPGVSKTLAEWRAKHYGNIRYKLNLTLEKMSPVLKGEIEISINNKADQIILDWRKLRGKEDAYSIKNVQLNGKTAEYEEINEHLVFKNVTQGENVIKLNFTSPISTSGSAITRYIDKEDGSEYIYSLFVPSDASTAFPVFDQPDLKAKFKLAINAPSSWNVIANTSFENSKAEKVFKKWVANDVVGSVSNPTVIEGENISAFEETKPISTYVFAFAAGNFAEIDCRGDSCGRPMSEAKTDVGDNSNTASDIRRFGQAQDQPLQSKIYVRKSQAEKFKQHSAEVFRLNRECVKYLEEYFDYKFPFPKYDLVLIPEFPFGGMEHAGATFLRESSIIFPSEPTKSDLVNRANLIFHEAAHQWFGDTVTMKWFDDLWLKEGFATFMGYKAMEKIMPEMNAWKVFYERTKQTAYLTDSTKGTTPIYQEIPNLSAAKSAYGNIVYNKAPSFLRQAEFYLGEKEFQTAVRSFLKKNEFKNATWQDLVTEFEIAKKEDLKDWGKAWVTQKGMPIFRTEIYHDAIEVENPKNKNIHGVAFSPKDILNGGGAWSTKIKSLAKYKNEDITEEVVEFDEETARKEQNYMNGFSFKNNKDPLLIFPNYQDYGYGIFLLDEKSRNYILANAQNEKDDFLRSMMYGSLWDSVREAELNPQDYVELVIKNVAAEKDEMIVSSMLSRTNTAFTYYLDEKTRNELAPKLEEILINKMQTAETQGQKITFYRAFLNVASSENARNLLKDFLNPKAQNQSPFTLKTKDKFDIITKLLTLGDKDAESLLAELIKTETSDDAKRYAYAARAGIATVSNKAKYWQDFTTNKEISESWIEAAFIPFNSPKHSELTLPYLEKALAELPNHKRNRKIFFINGWLGSFIGGQKSEKALAIVNKFLADNPNLDKDLRLKILENVDVIERAVKIRSKFRI